MVMTPTCSKIRINVNQPLHELTSLAASLAIDRIVRSSIRKLKIDDDLLMSPAKFKMQLTSCLTPQ